MKRTTVDVTRNRFQLYCNKEKTFSTFRFCAPQVAEQLMTIAYESGVNLFDTAEVYASGRWAGDTHSLHAAQTASSDETLGQAQSCQIVPPKKDWQCAFLSRPRKSLIKRQTVCSSNGVCYRGIDKHAYLSQRYI